MENKDNLVEKNIAPSKFNKAAHKENFNTVFRNLVEPNTTFKSLPTQHLFNWWKSFQPALPMRHQFSIDDHWLVAPYIYLIEILSNGRFLYRLIGEKVIELVGQNQANTIFDIKDTHSELLDLALYFQTIVDTKHAMKCHGTLALFSRNLQNFESFDCPLTDVQGNITHILGVITVID